MPLRDYNYYYQEETIKKKQEQSTYQDYQSEDDNLALEELLFFVNIAAFALASVLAIFIFSALSINSLLAFILSLPVGALALGFTQKTIKNQRLKQKNPPKS